ncbi:hypothetical protein H6P81_016145 [Aristolochia fimbriata]|uniref:Uncharacterized protein n=1 Tax=Aristolochia fimbriata TaxID=158543 RepID=A0AAV7E9J7_ARIFI|nr:hypothetical protein H6P81_016145 [Aristolochia fimbriata]
MDFSIYKRGGAAAIEKTRTRCHQRRRDGESFIRASDEEEKRSHQKKTQAFKRTIGVSGRELQRTQHPQSVPSIDNDECVFVQISETEASLWAKQLNLRAEVKSRSGSKTEGQG